MCVAAIAWDAHPRWQLVVAANRDEYHIRPAAPLARWDDGSGIIAGRDLQSGGTWAGISDSGRLVLVTNFRVPGYPRPDRPSRGGLVTALLGDADPQTVPIAAYNPFNLFHADRHSATFIGNYPQEQRMPLPAGVHGLSNGAYDAVWPKTRVLTAALQDWLAGDAQSPAPPFAPLFAALRREMPDPAQPAPLPAPEPRFAPVFIRDEIYGTRCSTLVLIDRQGRGLVIERRFSSAGQAQGETALEFIWP